MNWIHVAAQRGTGFALHHLVKLFIAHRPLQPGTALKIDGWLGSDGVPALLEACSEAEPPLVLDLRDLRDAEPAGIAALRRIVASGARVDAISPYVELLLSKDPA
jgi:hypothetical protein